MKQITFASFKGGAGKSTAAMAVASSLIKSGKRVALIDTDENLPLLDWQDAAVENELWSDRCEVFEADDLRSFESALEEADKRKFDYAIIDTRGGGSELNNACLVNTELVIIPSALTALDMTQALSTFEHTIELYQTMNIDIPVALLIQRVPVGKLTVSQKQDLEKLTDLPHCETLMHTRDAYAAIGKRGLLHSLYDQLYKNPMKRITATHMATAIEEADRLAAEFMEAIGDA